MTISYELGDALYLNITNRCTCRCDFCVRNSADDVNGADNLWLEREPNIDEIKKDISKRDIKKYKEVVFCGFGEPLMRYIDVIEVSAWLKEKYAGIPIRINTNGHANLIAGKDITPQLKGIVDTISISLNAKNAKEYEEICHSQYGEESYPALLDFAKKASAFVPNVILTVVDVLTDEDIETCRKIAEEVGVNFRVRTMIQ